MTGAPRPTCRTLGLGLASITACLAVSPSWADGAAIDADWFLTGTSAQALIDNAAFLPPAGAAPALEPFGGMIQLSETAMATMPETFKSTDLLGGNPQIFPGVLLGFVTADDDLVPVDQTVIRAGSLSAGDSFWDIIVQPGKVWSDQADDGWSRASFPFALMHSIEGETHNGVAMFLYKGDEISDLAIQITQQTAPFYVEDYFLATGRIPAAPAGAPTVDPAQLASGYEAQRAAEFPVLPWSELPVQDAALDAFNGEIAVEDNVLGGIAFGDAFYLKSCDTPQGPLPYCDRQRFGVWSVTKSAADALALLRLAQKYGPEVYDAKLVDYLPQAERDAAWDGVTFRDAVNMATGMARPDATEDDEPFDASYYTWYEAPTIAAKLEAVLSTAKPYGWGPGAKMRYRDEDVFILGQAMTGYLQAQEGDDANIWSMLEREVYAPIGISVMPMNKTVETDTGRDQPLMAYGMYPTIGDMVKIARLYQNGGKAGGTQILDPEMVAELMSNDPDRGLPSGGDHSRHYDYSLWRDGFDSQAGCTVTYPSMDGWGQNFVSMFPNEIVVVRVAKDWDGVGNADSTATFEAAAEKLGDLCVD